MSDVHLADWLPVENAPSQNTQAASSDGVTPFPRVIRLERPHDDYKLDLQVTKISLNEEIPSERFKLEQPAGTELVRVSDATESKQP